MIRQRPPGSGEEQTFEYDGMDRRDNRTDHVGGSTVQSGYKYIGSTSTLSGQEVSVGAATSRVSFDRDSDDRPLAVTLQASGSSTATTKTYATDANGNPTGLEETNGDVPAPTNRYVYDRYVDLDDAANAGITGDAAANPLRFQQVRLRLRDQDLRHAGSRLPVLSRPVPADRLLRVRPGRPLPDCRSADAEPVRLRWSRPGQQRTVPTFATPRERRSQWRPTPRPAARRSASSKAIPRRVGIRSGGGQASERVGGSRHRPFGRRPAVARYDAEAGILALESSVAREWPYGILVDGCLILDIDADRLLANVDVQIPRAAWGERAGLSWPPRAPRGALLVDEQAVSAKNFDDEVEVFVNAEGTLVEVRIGTARPDRSCALSDAVAARLENGRLVGFVVRLEAG